MLKILIFIALLQFCFFKLFAQNPTEKENVQIKEMTAEDIIENKDTSDLKVVSASRSSKNITDLPITIFVITAEQIQKNGYVTLTDVLKEVPGIRVSQPGTGFEGETFLMRGLTGNYYTKILINNIPIQPSGLGGIPIAAQLPIAQAERIEIIYGSASAIYGADAMAGVINIITKTTDNKTFAQINMSEGQYGYRHTDFMVAGKAGIAKNIFKFSLYGNYTSRDHLNILYDDKLYSPQAAFSFLSQVDRRFIDQFPPAQRDSIYTSILRQAYPLYRGSATQAEINSLPESSSLLGARVDFRGFTFEFNDMERKTFSTLGRNAHIFSMANPNTFIGERIQRYSASYSKNWRKLSFTANASYLRYRMNNQSSVGVNYISNNDNLKTNDGVSYTYGASDDYFIESLFVFKANNFWEITTGASFQLSSVLPKTNDLDIPFNENDYVQFSSKKALSANLNPILGDFGYNPYTFNNVGGFVQAYYNKNRFTFIGSIRGDIPSNYDGAIYNRLAFLYKISEKTGLRISSGYAFKSPSPSFRYASLASQDYNYDPKTQQITFTDKINYQQIPNENLKPEQQESFEFGIRHEFSKRIFLDANLSFTNTSNLIVAAFVPIDTLKYPKVSLDQRTGGNSFVRQYINDEKSRASLISLQTTLRFKKIIPVIKLDSDLTLTLSTGEKMLPDTLGTIDDYNTVPNWVLQWNLSFEPFKNAYVHIHNTYSDGWYNRFIPNAQFYKERSEFFYTQGYYTIDLTARYQISKFLSVFVKTTNLFNARYGGIDATGTDVDLRYNPQLGRNIQIGIGFR